MSNQQQPRQWFRFGSFFQAAQQPQPRPDPPTTKPTQQPANRPSVLQTRPNEVTVQRFPVRPMPVSAPAPMLPSLPRADAPTPNPQPTKTVLPAVPQPKPLALQLAPRVETPPVPPTRPLGASNEATINRSVTTPMPPSAPPQRFPQPLTSTPMPRSPPKTTSTTVPSLKLQPSETTNSSTPYSSPLSRTPPSMQTSPSKKASPGIVSIRSSSKPASPGRKLSEPTSLLSSPVAEPPSYSPPPSNTFPVKSPNQNHYVKPISESIKLRQTSYPPSSETDQAEQKSVLVQETLDKSRVIPGKQDVHDQNSMETTQNKNGAKEKGKTIPKKLHDSEKSGTRLILAGVNKGAVMDLSSTEKKESSGFRGNGKKLGSVLDGGKEETSNPNMEDKTHKKGMSIQSSTIRAFINNNVQGFNNSIVFNSSCRDQDPGVHLRFSRKDNVGRKEILKKEQSK